LIKSFAGFIFQVFFWQNLFFLPVLTVYTFFQFFYRFLRKTNYEGLLKFLHPQISKIKHKSFCFYRAKYFMKKFSTSDTSLAVPNAHLSNFMIIFIIFPNQDYFEKRLKRIGIQLKNSCHFKTQQQPEFIPKFSKITYGSDVYILLFEQPNIVNKKSDLEMLNNFKSPTEYSSSRAELRGFCLQDVTTPTLAHHYLMYSKLPPPYSKLPPPPRTAGSVFENPYRCPFGGEPYVKIPGTRISQIFLLQSLVTFW
jgi:hypothetical protein